MRLALYRLYQVLAATLTAVTMTTAGPVTQVEEDGGERGEHLHKPDSPYQPTFLPTPANVTFLSGEEAVMQCAIENRGTRTVVWRRASEPNPLTIGMETFVGDTRFVVRHPQHSLEWNLHIRHATPEDSGVYHCQVITRSRDIAQMILLHVDDKQYVPTFKPDIQISGSQFVEKGNTLTMTCNATGFDYPPTELDWFKDGMKLTNGRRLLLSKDVSLSEKTIVSKLQVSRAVMSDAGTYVCRASDDQITSTKVNVLNTDTDNEKRESDNHSTTWVYGGASRGGAGLPRHSASLFSLLTSLVVYLITS